MNGKDRLDGLDLDDHRVVHEHVNAITQLDGDSFVQNGKDLLAFDLDVESRQFITKALLVRPFEQSRAQSRMHALSGDQDAVGGLAVYQPWSVSVRVRALRVDAFRQSCVTSVVKLLDKQSRVQL